MTSNPTQHLVVDGSNIATEGRTNPSLAQLDEAVSAVSKQGYGPVTVIVDATFPRRIDPSEVEEFERRTLEGTIVTPPAGVVGRGDAFILQVAAQVDAVVLSNDSFQEFHGEHEWLLNEDGRLLGGKPVPNVGWVFSPRGPVRGAKSRQSVREAKSSKSEKPTKTPAKTAAKKSASKRKTTSPKQKNQTSSKEVSADSPMPVPKDPPASRRRRGAETRRDAQETGAKSSAPKPSAPKSSAPKSNGVKAKKSAKSKESNHLNDVTEFMSFVSAHSLGDTIQGEVERFSSHGCYLRVATAQCYLPSKAMGDPPPTKARDVVSKGQLVEAKVESLDAERRGINVSLIRVLPRADRSDQQKPSSLPNGRSISNTPRRSESIMATPKKAAKKRTTKKAAVKKTVAKKTTAKKAAKKAPAKKAAAKKAPAKKAAPKKAAAKKAPAKKAAPKKAAAKKAPAKKAAPKKAAAKKAPAKKAAPKKAAAKKRTTKKAAKRTTKR